MTPQQIADQKALLRAELERLDALEKAQRPALAAGQVWRHPELGISIVLRVKGGEAETFDTCDHDVDDEVAGFSIPWEYIGLARDVLRVVQPDAVEQVAPVQDEPTGAELVGKRVSVMTAPGDLWEGPFRVRLYDQHAKNGTRYYVESTVSSWWVHDAKLYREGVTP